MKTKIVHKSTGGGGGCAGGTCPIIYETDRDTYLIKGKCLKASEKKPIDLSEGEDIIEIPKSFLQSFKR